MGVDGNRLRIGLVAAAATTALVVGGLVAPGPAQAAAPAAITPCPAAVDSRALAAGLAAACGGRVEAVAGRSETRQVFANPDGTWTLEEHLRPRWARAEGSGKWVEADATLRAMPDGTVAPVAGTLPMSFSGGGDGPLATMRRGDVDLTLSWPTALPTPRLTGTTATYADVLPGVDLEIRAEADGFVHVVVVHSRAAAENPALRTLTYKVAANGATLHTTAEGSTMVRDARGATLFTSPTPMMWDSRGSAADPAARGLGPASEVRSRIAAMRAQLKGPELSLVPDVAMLTDPATVYPVYLDPPWSGGLSDNAWTHVWSRANVAGSSFWQNATAQLNAATRGAAGSGRVCDVVSGSVCQSPQYLVRSMFRMTLSGLAGKHLLGAKFRIKQGWAWHCSPVSNAKLWYIDGDISPSTTWNAQPAWNSSVVSVVAGNRKDGATSGCLAPDNIEFDATAMVARAFSQGRSTVTLGLRAENEGTTGQWKRFFHNTALLTADYNSYPSVGPTSTNPTTTCVTGDGSQPAANLPLVNDNTPDLRMVVNDADTETDLIGSFEWQTWNGSAWVASGQANDPIGRAPGATSVVTPTLSSTGTYRWRAKVLDPFFYGAPQTDASPTSTSWCEFALDITPPPVPQISSSQYPADCAPCGGVGTTGRFTLTPGAPDVVGFWWGTSDPPVHWAPAPTPGAPVDIDLTPRRGGFHWLFVTSQDTAGNRRSAPMYSFTVDDAQPELARWLLNDANGAPTLADDTGHGNDLTLVGGALEQPGRLVSGSPALTLTNATTAGQQAYRSALLDTSLGLTIAAWVKLDVKREVEEVIVSQTAASNSAVKLVYSPSSDSFNLATSSMDGTPQWTSASSTTAPKVGVWTHLTGVLDTETDELRIYVNGVLEGTTTGAFSRSSAGQFTVGGGWDGSIQDVRVWQRVLFPSEIRDMVDPLGAGRVGEWHFGEVDGVTATDSSDYAHDLTLYGGATIPADGAGYDGTGLLLMDGTGSADADGPVVYTDQSFSVSGWAKLTDDSASRVFASQDGEHSSAFMIMYDQSAGGRWAMKMLNVDDPVDTSAVTVVSAAAAQLNVWTHLAGVYDANKGVMTLSVNGQMVGSAAVPGAWHASGAFSVGRGRVAGTGAMHWVGAIDELRANAGVRQTYAGDWRFSGCTGSPAECPDAGTPAHPFTLDPLSFITSSGYAGGPGLRIGEVGSGGRTAGPVLVTDESFTVSAWVSLSDMSINQTAISQEGTTNSAFSLGFNADSDGRWSWRMWHSDLAGAATTTVLSSVPAEWGVWTHLVGKYDAQTGRLILYVNGVESGAANFTSTWSANGAFALGRLKVGNIVPETWIGAIDEVRAYQGLISDVTSLQ